MKTYSDYLYEISADELYEGLLGYGMMGQKLPPMLTSVPFFNYCKSLTSNFGCYSHGYVTYRCVRNVNSYRSFGIPTPMAYQRLCKELSKDWDDICSRLDSLTASQHHLVSRVHLQKMSGTRALFAMDYKEWNLDGDPEPSLLLGKHYKVSADVSRCFPSIYTHSVEWALVGKETAKQNRAHNGWASKVDKVLRQTTNNETHGVLIGPHASNLISEIVLTAVDSELTDNWNYTRHIDDYTCYVSSEDEARKFLVQLDKSLGKYGLSLNQRKTKIEALPLPFGQRWVRELTTYPLPEESMLKYPDVKGFYDKAIELAKAEGDFAVLRYALKMLSKRTMSRNAQSYFAEMSLHLANECPYLIDAVEECVIIPTKMESDQIKSFSDTTYRDAMESGNYQAAYFTLYFAVKYDFELCNFDIDSILNSEDCLLKLFALVYCRKKGLARGVLELRKNALELSKLDQDFDDNWLFVYEALEGSEISCCRASDWRGIKNAKVSFLLDL